MWPLQYSGVWPADFFWIHRAFFSLGIGGTNLVWSSFFGDFYAVAESYAETFELG